MARSLPKVCPFLVTVDLKLKWPELPRGPNYPALPYLSHDTPDVNSNDTTHEAMQLACSCPSVCMLSYQQSTNVKTSQ